MRLDLYDAASFDRGASRLTEAAWIVVSGLLVRSWLPGSAWRTALLRLFGARLGRGVVVKPGIRIKFPWRLSMGDHCWIGEDAWLDNLAEVRLGSHVCVSQGAFLGTGNHDWSSDRFDLLLGPILIEDRAWVCAGASLAPGTTMREGAVLATGGVAAGELAAWTIYAGNPARPLRSRRRNGRAPSG